MAQIFISYKRKNKDQVFSIVRKIENELDVKCWVDLDGIESSVQFASVICNAIDSAEVVLFMHSSVHLSIDFENDWTIKELNYAKCKNKRIVLVKLDSSPLDNIFLLDYGSKNNIDSCDQVQLSKLINDLRIWLNLTQHGSILDSMQQENIEKWIFSKIPKLRIKERGQLYGFQDRNGNEVIACKWKSAFDFHDGLARVEKEYRQWGFINEKGEEVIPCKWKSVSDFCDGLARVEDYCGTGYIDKTGKVIIPCKFKNSLDFHDGMARSYSFNDGKWGYIDKTGKLVIPYMWNEAQDFSDGLAFVRKGYDQYYINKYGHIEFTIKCMEAERFYDGYARIKGFDNYKWGLIDKKGKEVVRCNWDRIGYFNENFASVMNEKELWGYVNKNGILEIPCQWKGAGKFREGLAAVKDETGKWGFIDKRGNLVIGCQWESVEGFSDGYALVSRSCFSSKTDIIDKTGNIVKTDVPNNGFCNHVMPASVVDAIFSRIKF